MAAKGAEWLIVLLFFVCFFACTAGEVMWLHRNKAVEVGRAFAFSFASNLFCITVGFFVSMVTFGVILAMAWDGSLQTVKGGDASIWAAIIAAVVFPFFLLALAKFLLLKVFRFETIPDKLKYAALASLVFFFAVSLIPCTTAFLLFR